MFEYDWLGRGIRKTVYDGSSGTYVLSSDKNSFTMGGTLSRNWTPVMESFALISGALTSAARCKVPEASEGY